MIQASTRWAIEAVQLGVQSQGHRNLHWDWANPILAGNYDYYDFAKKSYAFNDKESSNLPTSLDVVIMEGFAHRIQKLFEDDLLKYLGFWDKDGDLCGHMLSSLIPGSQWVYNLSEPGDFFWRLQGRHWMMTADKSGPTSFHLAIHKAFLEAALPKAIEICDETGGIESARFHNVYKLDPEAENPYWEYLPLGDIFNAYHGILDRNLEFCDYGKDESAKHELAKFKNMRNEQMIEIVQVRREKYLNEQGEI